MLRCCFVCLVVFACASSAFADESNGQLEIYFIDVEGGAATLFVTPENESLLIDSGYPDNNGRDRNRILNVIKKVAGLNKLDHAAVTHWHRDHYGNHAALSTEIKVGQFWDRGIPDLLKEDKQFEQRIADYRAATQNKSNTLKAGDRLPLKSGKTELSCKIMTASRKVVPNIGPPNPFAKLHQPRDRDPSDNADSVSFLVEFGSFRFLCCGDLTWNIEAKLVSPNNPVGRIDMFMVTHHGLPTSNNPAFVNAIDPIVAVMCNGPTKGGHPETLKTLKGVKSRKDIWQLHRNVMVAPEEQAPKKFIANSERTSDCQGNWIKASVSADGSYAVQIGAEGKAKKYESRSQLVAK